MNTLEISTHIGGVDGVEVEKYDAEEITSQLNNNEVQAINFGENIYIRIDIKNIKVIESE